MGSKSGDGHQDCFASELGGCTSISREHYVSETLLKRVSVEGQIVNVRNLAFLPIGKLTGISISKLTSKVLCGRHNSDLSPFDSEADSLMKGLDVGASGRTVIDGDKLERWMLKTLIGGCYSGAFPAPSSDDPNIRCFRANGVKPGRTLLEILFRNRAFSDGQGLYVGGSALVRRGVEQDDGHLEAMSFHVLNDDEGAIGGLYWELFGIPFYLNLAQSMHGDGCYRPSSIVTKSAGTGIDFLWAGESDGDGLVFDVITIGPKR